MSRLLFLHQSLCEYFAAEAIAELCTDGLRLEAASHLREATLHELDCFVREYEQWGSALHVLPHLVQDQKALEELIRWSRNWQNNPFGLDCLPLLYARVGRSEDLWRLVRDNTFQQKKLEKHAVCYRSLLDDVRTALALAVKEHRLPELVRFGFLLPWAAFQVRFAGELKIVPFARKGMYKAAFRQVDLLTGPVLAPTRYRLLLVIAWIAALNSDRDDPEQADRHLDNARRALSQAVRAPATIASEWSEVVLKLVETLLAKGITEAIEVIKLFGGQPGQKDQGRKYACHYLAQLATSSTIPRNITGTFLREAENLAGDLPGEARPSEVGFIASAYASLECEEDAKRLCEGFVGEFTARIQSGEGGPSLAALAEEIANLLKDLRDTSWATGICTGLLPGEDLPQPFRAHVLACVGERLLDLRASEEGGIAVNSAITAAERIAHPWVQAPALKRALQAAQKVEGRDQTERLLQVLKLARSCLEKHLAMPPDTRQLGAFFLFKKDRDERFSDWQRQGYPPGEFDWLFFKGEMAWARPRDPIAELWPLVCALLESLQGAGEEPLKQAREVVSRFIALLEQLGEQEQEDGDDDWRDALFPLLNMALKLDGINETNLSSQAMESFVPIFQRELSDDPPSVRRFSYFISERELIRVLGELAVSRQDLWNKHRDQLDTLLPHIEKKRPGFLEALRSGDLSRFEPEYFDDEQYEEFEREEAHLKGRVMRPMAEWVDRANEALSRGNLIEAAECFEADTFSVKDYEEKRQYEGFIGRSFLALASRLGQVQKVEQAAELVRLLIRSLELSVEEDRGFLGQIVYALTAHVEIPLDIELLRWIKEQIDDQDWFLIMVTRAFLRRGDWARVEKLLPEVMKLKATLRLVPPLLDLADECVKASLTDSAKKLLNAVYKILNSWSRNNEYLSVAPAAARRLYQRGMLDEGRRIFQRCLEEFEVELDLYKEQSRYPERLDRDIDLSVAVLLATVARELQPVKEKELAGSAISALSQRVEEFLQQRTESDRNKVEFLCKVARALADFENGTRASDLLARASRIAEGFDHPAEKEKWLSEVARAMLAIGRREERAKVVSVAREKITDPVWREEVYLDYANTLADDGPAEEAEEAYELLKDIPRDRRDDRWVWRMASLLAKLGRNQEWPSKWSRRLADLLSDVERLETVDCILGCLIMRCSSEAELLRTAEVCRTMQLPRKPQ